MDQWADRLIFRVKRALKQVHSHSGNFSVLQSMKFLMIHNCYVLFAKIFHGRPLISYKISQLVSTGKSTHFKCQTIPKACKSPILLIFTCYSLWTFWGSKILTTFFMDVHKSLAMESVGPDKKINLLSSSNDPPKQVNPIFCRFFLLNQ